MADDFTLADYLDAAGVEGEGDLVYLGGSDAAGNPSSGPTLVSSVAGVVTNQASPSVVLKEVFDPKQKGPVKTPQKRPPASSNSESKRLRVTQSHTTELSLEDFEAYAKVGKLRRELFIKWNADVSKREQGTNFKAENLVLAREREGVVWGSADQWIEGEGVVWGSTDQEEPGREG